MEPGHQPGGQAARWPGPGWGDTDLMWSSPPYPRGPEGLPLPLRFAARLFGGPWASGSPGQLLLSALPRGPWALGLGPHQGLCPSTASEGPSSIRWQDEDTVPFTGDTGVVGLAAKLFRVQASGRATARHDLVRTCCHPSASAVLPTPGALSPWPTCFQ